ncbi:MAG: VOC family protein [Planctomycetota bacterium]|jgi:uncharacterized glyoxalase superfamily protein PhnB
MRNTLHAIQVILVIFVAAIVGCKERKETDNKKENVMYKKLTTNMMVEDVGRTVDFYSEVLGFELVIGVPENSQEIVTTKQKGQALGFAIIKCGNIEMMFQAKLSLAKEVPEFEGMEIGGALTFYIEVQDVRELYAKLKDKVTIVKDMQTTFYGKKEFYIRDCNGYILTFAGEIQEQSS